MFQNNRRQKVIKYSPSNFFKQRIYPLSVASTTTSLPTTATHPILLTEDFLVKICEYLELPDILKLQSVSRLVNAMINTNLFWENLLKTHFPHVDLECVLCDIENFRVKNRFLPFEKRTRALNVLNGYREKTTRCPILFLSVLSKCSPLNAFFMIYAECCFSSLYLCAFNILMGCTFALPLTIYGEATSDWLPLRTFFNVYNTMFSLGLMVATCRFMLSSGCSLSNHLIHQATEKHRIALEDADLPETPPKGMKHFRNHVVHSKELPLLFKHYDKDALSPKQVYETLYSAERVVVFEV